MKKFHAFFIAPFSILSVQSANAALPAGISTGLTGIQADMSALVNLVWPAVIAGVAAVIIVKLFKRFANKI